MRPVLLVLGTERSGSTWLANILDAHPEVDLLMEPFAAFARFFPGLPGREVRAGTGDAELVEVVRRGLALAAAHKHPLLYRPGRPPRLRSLDARLARAVRAAARGLRRPPPLWLRRFELLNLNAAALPARELPAKHTAPATLALKELRLNFKVGLLAAALPQARIAAIVRGPTAQIASIERLLGRGHLADLAQSLPRIHATVAAHPSFARYAALAAAIDPAADRTSALALWWLVQNQTLLADLRRSGLPHLVVRHEELCAAPDRGAEALLGFAGLAPAPGVLRFVRWSSSGEGDPASPVDTRRPSALHARRAHAAAPAELRRRIERTLRRAVDAGAVDVETHALLAGATLPGDAAPAARRVGS
jgi:hypothetical protein